MGVLKGISDFYNDSISDTLLYNLQQWLSYGLIEKGAYTVVAFNQSTSGYTTLKRSYDERYSGAGRVYEGLGPSWVWQSGVSVPTGYIAPFNVSGVYVDDSYYPLDTTGSYSHVVDYANGRIIFNNAISSTKTVKCEYVMNDVAVYLTSGPQWRIIMDQYISKFNNLNTLQPSGMASVLKDNRVWLPCVAIDIQERTQTGLQLGGGTVCNFAAFYHIFADTAFANRALIDIINDQEEKKLILFDVNNSPFPLGSSGNLVSGAKTYLDLINDTQYYLTSAYVDKSRGGSISSVSDVQRGEVRQSILVNRYLGTI